MLFSHHYHLFPFFSIFPNCNSVPIPYFNNISLNPLRVPTNRVLIPCTPSVWQWENNFTELRGENWKQQICQSDVKSAMKFTYQILMTKSPFGLLSKFWTRMFDHWCIYSPVKSTPRGILSLSVKNTKDSQRRPTELSILEEQPSKEVDESGGLVASAQKRRSEHHCIPGFPRLQSSPVYSPLFAVYFESSSFYSKLWTVIASLPLLARISQAFLPLIHSSTLILDKDEVPFCLIAHDRRSASSTPFLPIAGLPLALLQPQPQPLEMWFSMFHKNNINIKSDHLIEPQFLMLIYRSDFHAEKSHIQNLVHSNCTYSLKKKWQSYLIIM